MAFKNLAVKVTLACEISPSKLTSINIGYITAYINIRLDFISIAGKMCHIFARSTLTYAVSNNSVIFFSNLMKFTNYFFLV